MNTPPYESHTDAGFRVEQVSAPLERHVHEPTCVGVDRKTMEWIYGCKCGRVGRLEIAACQNYRNEWKYLKHLVKWQDGEAGPEAADGGKKQNPSD